MDLLKDYPALSHCISLYIYIYIYLSIYTVVVWSQYFTSRCFLVKMTQFPGLILISTYFDFGVDSDVEKDSPLILGHCKLIFHSDKVQRIVTMKVVLKVM